MKKIDSIEELNSILKSFEGFKFHTNSYFFEQELIRLIDSQQLFYERFSDNLILYIYKKDFNFYELFYYLKDLNGPMGISCNSSIVMEIPYRGAKNFPKIVVDYWNNSGFVNHINRDLLGLTKPIISNFSVLNSNIVYLTIDNLDEAEIVYTSIRDTFDLFTGDMLTINEIKVSIEKKEIIGAYKNGTLTGFIKFYDKNKVSWIGHLVVLPKYGGEGIGKDLVAYYLKFRTEQGFTNFQQWVISDNAAALKLYSNFGFKFTNKNSISLLKLKK